MFQGHRNQRYVLGPLDRQPYIVISWSGFFVMQWHAFMFPITYTYRLNTKNRERDKDKKHHDQ